MSFSRFFVSSILLLAASGSLCSAFELGECSELKGTVDLSKYKDVSFRGCKIGDIVLSGIRDNAVITFVGSSIEGSVSIQQAGKSANVRFVPAADEIDEAEETDEDEAEETDEDEAEETDEDEAEETDEDEAEETDEDETEETDEGGANTDTEKEFGGKSSFTAGSALVALLSAAALAL